MRKVDTFLSLASSTKGKTKQQTCWAYRTFLSSDICFGSFPNKFVMYGVTIESPIESPMNGKSHDPILIR
jgi:hypothetical protein